MGRKLQTWDYLFGQISGILETHRIEVDLRDHGVIWHHHRHGSEKSLQIVGQHRSPCVSWIHRDIDGAGVDQLDLIPVKRESGRFHLDRILNRDHLLRNHRQDLQVNSIKFIKTAPGSRWSQSFEKFAHSLEI